jgi:hypothetical protein
MTDQLGEPAPSTAVLTDPDLGLLHELVRRGQGEDGALPEIKLFFDRRPDLARNLGNALAHAELTLALRIAQQNRVTAEAVLRSQANLRRELAAPGDSRLNELLVAHVALLELAHAEAILTAQQADRLSPGRADYLDRRVHRSAARLQAAAKTLAIVRKLMAVVPSPLELAAAMQARDEESPARKMRRVSRAMARN